MSTADIPPPFLPSFIYSLFLSFLLSLLSYPTQIRKIRAKDRTPSFYTSRSIVHLSGLSVADPSPRDLNRSKDSCKSDYEREENWVKNENENEEYDDEEDEDEDEDESRPMGIQKTTSMANFYYKKSRSSDDFLYRLEKEKDRGTDTDKESDEQRERDQVRGD